VNTIRVINYSMKFYAIKIKFLTIVLCPKLRVRVTQSETYTTAEKMWSVSTWHLSHACYSQSAARWRLLVQDHCLMFIVVWTFFYTHVNDAVLLSWYPRTTYPINVLLIEVTADIYILCIRIYINRIKNCNTT